MNDPSTPEPAPDIGAELARLNARYGQHWSISHDGVSGLWWAASTDGTARLAADSAAGLSDLLAEVSPRRDRPGAPPG